MRIFLQSSVFLPTPSPGAGAVEYLVAGLARELAAQHEVHLFALEGSQAPGCTLHTVPPEGSPEHRENGLAIKMAEAAVECGFPDVIFDHSLYMVGQRMIDAPAVSMSHGMAPIPTWAKNVVFTTLHHGRLHKARNPKALHLGLDLKGALSEPGLRFTGERKRVMWVGRLLPYKRPMIAISVAHAANIPIDMIGVGNDAYRDHVFQLFKQQAPIGSRWLGPLPHEETLMEMRQAKAVLFTSNESEPAGLVMLEAQAVGTPVIAFSETAAGEMIAPLAGYIVDGVTGFGGMVDALKEVNDLSPVAGRAWIESHFTIEAMGRRAETYLYSAMEGDRW